MLNGKNIFLTADDTVIDLQYVAAIETKDQFLPTTIFHLSTGAILECQHDTLEDAIEEKWKATNQIRESNRGPLLESIEKDETTASGSGGLG